MDVHNSWLSSFVYLYIMYHVHTLNILPYMTWKESYIYIFKAMCAWYIAYRWKNDDDQKSWKSCPICPRNREGAGSRYFSDLVHLMSSTNFVVIMPHEVVPSLMNYTFKFYQDCWTIRAYSHKYWNYLDLQHQPCSHFSFSFLNECRL